MVESPIINDKSAKVGRHEMVSIDFHCNLLSEAIFGIDGQHTRLLDVCNQLKFASGIDTVDFDTGRFIPGPSMCTGADELLYQEDQVLSFLAREVSIFYLVWAALECLVNEINPPNAPRNGKINKLCNFLNIHGEDSWVLREYIDELSRFQYLMSESQIASRSQSRDSIPDFVNVLGEGVYRVYAVRNAFAHGDLITPFPEEGSPEDHPDVQVVTVATRLVLFTIQFTILADYDHNLPVALCSAMRWEDEENPLSLSDVFLNLHNGSDQFVRQEA